MTRERISKLSEQDLVKLAEKLSLDIYEEFDLPVSADHSVIAGLRREIEDQIFDILEENRQERQESDSHPVNYHQKHFLSIEEFFGYPIEDETSFFTFPDQYNVTRIMLMLRDPEWAYAYWDISNQDRSRITAEPGFVSFSVVLREVPREEGASPTGRAPADGSREPVEMRIPVQADDHSWYVNIPRRDRNYCAELAAEYRDRTEILAKSGLSAFPEVTSVRTSQVSTARKAKS
jgi:hypothetical protein